MDVITLYAVIIGGVLYVMKDYQMIIMDIMFIIGQAQVQVLIRINVEQVREVIYLTIPFIGVIVFHVRVGDHSAII
tara:strand:- start:135 stop:362 length:228 start_codon:yes stop_codon:yes gene_type:complete